MAETFNESQGQILKILVFLLGLFLVLRLPGLSFPYHQDEFKNVMAAASPTAVGGLTHPPLLQIWFLLGHFFVGGDWFRLWPLIFSLLILPVLFAVTRRRAGEQAAWWSVLLFSICFYGVWSSLMADVDGSVLALLFVLAVYYYDRQSKFWLGLILLAGLLLKLSFVLVIGAIVVDYLFANRLRFSTRLLIKAGTHLFILAGSFVLALLAAKVFFRFNLEGMIHHAQYYTAGGRNYLQILVQMIKAVFYLSPLVLAPLFLISRETIQRLRPFFFYIIFGLVFYFGLFDFSRGALDKYLMYLIVPLVAIGGEVISRIMTGISTQQIKFSLLIGGGLAAGLLALNFLPHEVFSLYPKTEWFSRVLRGRWLMLNPFTGGSGPLGFYVSFLFIAASFILTFIFGLAGWLKKSWRQVALIMILSIGMVYNLVFAEEFSFGRINGNASAVLDQAIDFIKQSPSIKSVITYNDIGAYKLNQIEKYAGRFYAAPQFEESHKAHFAKHNQESGYYLVVEIPLLYDGFYKEFFSHCQSLWSARSGVIPAHIYKCQL